MLCALLDGALLSWPQMVNWSFPGTRAWNIADSPKRGRSSGGIVQSNPSSGGVDGRLYRGAAPEVLGVEMNWETLEWTGSSGR